MVYYMSYYNDTIGPDAQLALSGPVPHRVIYVQQGSAVVNGTELPAGEALYADGPVEATTGSDGARLFRWELDRSPGQVPANIESMLRMTRECWSINIEPGSEWLLRLDSIILPGDDLADCHTHPGPGIRALLSGQFIIRQTSEDGGGEYLGDPWWETGTEACISKPGTDEDVHFLRVMVLPSEFEGRPDTATWMRKPPEGIPEWRLYFDQHVTL